MLTLVDEALANLHVLVASFIGIAAVLVALDLFTLRQKRKFVGKKKKPESSFIPLALKGHFSLPPFSLVDPKLLDACLLHRLFVTDRVITLNTQDDGWEEFMPTCPEWQVVEWALTCDRSRPTGLVLLLMKAIFQRLAETPSLFHPSEPLPRLVFTVWLQEFVRDYYHSSTVSRNDDEPELVSEDEDRSMRVDDSKLVLKISHQLEYLLLLFTMISVDSKGRYMANPIFYPEQRHDPQAWRVSFWRSIRHSNDGLVQACLARVAATLGFGGSWLKLMSSVAAKEYLDALTVPLSSVVEVWINDLQKAVDTSLVGNPDQDINRGLMYMKAALACTRSSHLDTMTMEYGRAYLLLGTAFLELPVDSSKQGLDCLEKALADFNIYSTRCVSSISTLLRYIALVALCRNKVAVAAKSGEYDPQKERIADDLFALHVKCSTCPTVSTIVPLLPSIRQTLDKARLHSDMSKPEFVWERLREEFEVLLATCRLQNQVLSTFSESFGCDHLTSEHCKKLACLAETLPGIVTAMTLVDG